MPKMRGYITTFKHKGGDKNINQLMPLCIDNYKLLEICKTICFKTGDLKDVEVDALPVCDGRYIKTKKNMMRDVMLIFAI